jgi:hypothetical protein
VTIIPDENYDHDVETKCYQALLDDGCRPLFPISLLPLVSTNADTYRDLLRPWTRYPDTCDSEDWMVFSRQLQRWKEFRTWQHVERRRPVTFAEFLGEHRRDSERIGGSIKWIASPRYEEATRMLWERLYGHIQQLNEENAEAVMSSYAEAATRLVADCGFVQPFQLHQDPRQQDQWTTYVEYLAFECYWLRWRVRYARKLRRQQDAEWEGLVRAGLVEPLKTYDELTSMEIENMRERELRRATLAKRSSTAATSTTVTAAAAIDVVEEMQSQTVRNPRSCRSQQPQNHTQKNMQSFSSPIDVIARRDDVVDKYVDNTPKYRIASAEARHQRCRVEWVQSEISKITAQQKAAGESGSTMGSISKNRQPIYDGDVKEHRRTKETMVGSLSDNPRITRSKKCKLRTDDGTQGLQLEMKKIVTGETDGPRARSKKKRKVTHEQFCSEDPSRVLTQVNSTVATVTRRCRQPKRISYGNPAVGSSAERLKTLRPRVDGKAVTNVGRFKT